MYKVENEGLLAVILLIEITTVNKLMNLMYGKSLAPVSPFSIFSLIIHYGSIFSWAFMFSTLLAAISDGSELVSESVFYTCIYTLLRWFSESCFLECLWKVMEIFSWNSSQRSSESPIIGIWRNDLFTQKLLENYVVMRNRYMWK